MDDYVDDFAQDYETELGLVDPEKGTAAGHIVIGLHAIEGERKVVQIIQPKELTKEDKINMAKKLAFRSVTLEIVSAIFTKEDDEEFKVKPGCYVEFDYESVKLKSSQVDQRDGLVEWNHKTVLKNFREFVGMDLLFAIREGDDAELGETFPLPLYEAILGIMDERIEERNYYEKELPLS